jgi:sugar phosphate isomerase/epimerase
MNTLAINAIGDDLEAAAEYCRSEGLGLEVTGFALPEDLEGDLPASIDRHRKAAEGIRPLILHGPFFELVVTSSDPAIVEVCHRRHKVSLEVAYNIGASLYIAHTNFRPMIRNPSYRKNFTARTLEFWLPYADWAAERGITICLENLWEPGPEIQADVIEKADHAGLRASFDNGHVLVFSRLPAAQWIETLGSMIVHSHFHDNSGELDEHKAVGDGKEDWPALLEALRRHAPETVLVAECDSLEANKQSIARIRAM